MSPIWDRSSVTEMQSPPHQDHADLRQRGCSLPLLQPPQNLLAGPQVCAALGEGRTCPTGDFFVDWEGQGAVAPSRDFPAAKTSFAFIILTLRPRIEAQAAVYFYFFGYTAFSFY